LPSSPTSGNEQNEDSENHWKPRNYLLLMAGLTVLGIGMGDIVDWHMTSHLRHSSAQPATTNKGQDIALLATSDPELPEQDKASLSSPANRANSPGTTLLLKKTADAKLEKSSFILKSAAQGAATAARAADSQSTASLTPSAAVPLAGPVRNLDPTITPQLTPARLLHRVDPVVPDFAKNADSNGTVLLSAVIGIDGKLKDVKFVSGDRALAIEAFRAVRDWRYRPYMLNGKPVAAETRIVMNFKP
jgi:TonB family protein